MPLSRVALTAVPQRTALSHAFGGLAAGLVGTAKYYLWLGDGELTQFRTAAIVAEVLLGFLTCTGSLMAAGKLQEVMPHAPDHLQRAEHHQLRAARDRALSGIWLVDRSHAGVAVPDRHRARARVRRPAASCPSAARTCRR